MNLKSLKTAAATFLGASLLAGVPLPAEAAEIPLFIFAGQSNMVGYSANSDQLVGTPYAGVQSKVVSFRAGADGLAMGAALATGAGAGLK